MISQTVGHRLLSCRHVRNRRHLRREAPARRLPGSARAYGERRRHRGPDQQGILRALPEIRAGLASRRLSIIDLTGGDQPIANEDGSVHVGFNGEIYNHRELRADLERRGHTFRTQCDTEVIVHLYEEAGIDCLDRLQGMFALAVVDTRGPRLLLARDGSGMKPLYWTVTSSGLLFGSEIRALLASGLVQTAPDRLGIQCYRMASYVPAPRTGFAGIEKLPAEDGSRSSRTASGAGASGSSASTPRLSPLGTRASRGAGHGAA